MKRLYDLTHRVDENTYHPYGAASFRNLQMYASHGCRHAYVTMSLHFGTHMDAPWHMVREGKRLDQISVQELAGGALVADVSEEYGPDRNGSREITQAVLEKTLEAHGHELAGRDALIIHTGWAALFVTEPVRYYRDYPTLAGAACEWLAERRVRLVGLDVPDLDLPGRYEQLPFCPVNHRLLLGRGIYIIENVGGQIGSLLNRRIDLLPAPLNLGGDYASGAPLRLLAEADEISEKRRTRNGVFI